MGFGFDGFSIGFGAFGILFTIIFVLFIVVFVVMAVSGIRTWNRNNHSPRLSVSATIVSKRTDISHHQTDGLSSTRYYATFQVASGDRMELSVSGPEYGMLAEGDTGELSFQGTRFLSFERGKG